MEDLWIPLTLGAAFAQNLRSLLQKRLTGALSVNGASYVRFCYALPFALLYLALLVRETGLPGTSAAFWIYCAVASLAQIFASACLVAAFTVRNFAVSTALSKTEVVQAAAVGFTLLGDRVPSLAAVGIAVSLLGVLLLNSSFRLGDVLRADRGLLLGLLAGSGLALAVVGFRGAALALPQGGTFLRAGFVLAMALAIQTLVMGLYLWFREPGQLTRVARSWRGGISVGLCGVAASAGWFTAMTLQTAALVRALGQVELLFALLTSWWLFREPMRPRELTGLVLLVAGIYLLL